jgi:hypothetical protein
MTDQPAETYPVALIKWSDAHAGDGGWLSMDDYEDDGDYIITTVGFLVPADQAGGKQNHVSVWQTITDGEGIHPMHIPVGMVKKIILLNA